MLFDALAATSELVASTTKRNEKVEYLADVLGHVSADEIIPAVAFLSGTTPLGRIGVGWAMLSEMRSAAAKDPSLTIGEVGIGEPWA